MKKTILFVALFVLIALHANSQDYKRSGISVAVSSGAGFLVLNQVNGGAFGQSPYNFKPSLSYWGASFEAKRKLHGFGIEYEQQKFGEKTYVALTGMNIKDMTTVSQVQFNYFNLYYKFHIPFEYKKINPYIKGSLILPIYVYSYERTWTDTFSGPGSDSNSNPSMGGSFAIHVGANYHINDTFSAFTELGAGPVIWKLGARMSFLH
jgi:hypothetical protein